MTFKRYIYRRKSTVYFFTKKPAHIYDRAWVDYYGQRHPLCCLQENEADFDFESLPKNKVIEVELNVKLKDYVAI